MCVSTIGSYSTLGTKVKIYGKSQFESWVFGFSLIFDFSVYLKNSSRITFHPLGWGTMFQVLKVSENLCILAIPYWLFLCLFAFAYAHAMGRAHAPPPCAGPSEAPRPLGRRPRGPRLPRLRTLILPSPSPRQAKLS